ncbi:putative transposase, partial [Escherichia coli P0304799.3]
MVSLWNMNFIISVSTPLKRNWMSMCCVLMV